MKLLEPHLGYSTSRSGGMAGSRQANAGEQRFRPTHVRVVLPAFNEERALTELIPRIAQTLSETSWNYDIVVVDDGSSDNTVQVARGLQCEFPVDVICHEVNRGLGAAITTCLTEGMKGLDDNDIVVAMDADNTHPPQLISRMVPMIREGHDVVIASRYQSGGRVVGLARHREWLSFAARVVMQTALPIRGCRDYTCGYRAYRVGLLREASRQFQGVLVRESGFACMADLLLNLNRCGAVVGEVPLLLRYDFKSGASKMRIIPTVYRSLRMVMRHRLRRS
jgi:dolichol-phosphate mannosyltransferase